MSESLRCRSIQLSLTEYIVSLNTELEVVLLPSATNVDSQLCTRNTGKEKRQQKVWVKVRRLSWNRLNSYKFMAMLLYVTRKRSATGALTMYVVCCHDLCNCYSTVLILIIPIAAKSSHNT